MLVCLFIFWEENRFVSLLRKYKVPKQKDRTYKKKANDTVSDNPIISSDNLINFPSYHSDTGYSSYPGAASTAFLCLHQMNCNGFQHREKILIWGLQCN